MKILHFFTFFLNYHLTYLCYACIILLVFAWNAIYNMREWLSGGAPPCQGGGRGFDPRLALLVIKKGYPIGYPFFIIEKCEALLERMLPCSKGSISRGAKAPLGRARTKVHWTLWHPARSFLDNKRDLFHIPAPQLSGFL